MNQKPKDYYVYLHRRKTDGNVFYVGKGTSDRAFQRTGRRSEYWERIVSKHGYIVEIYIDGLQEWYAFELEKELISYYGRENLCNFTDGGNAFYGYVFTKETIKKITLKTIGVKRPQHVIDAIILSKSRAVTCSNGMEFKSGADAARWIKENINKKASKSAIYFSCNSNGSYNTYGFSWRWKDSGIKPVFLGRSKNKKISVKNNKGLIFESLLKAQKWLIGCGHKTAQSFKIIESCKSKETKYFGYKWDFNNE